MIILLFICWRGDDEDCFITIVILTHESILECRWNRGLNELSFVFDFSSKRSFIVPLSASVDC